MNEGLSEQESDQALIWMDSVMLPVLYIAFTKCMVQKNW